MMDRSAHRREDERRRLRAIVLPNWTALRAHLSELEQRVLSLRLGLVSDRPITQALIARRLHVSVVTVASLEKSARRKVGDYLT